MTTSASLHKRGLLLLVTLFIVFSAFTTDVLNLREELYILSCPYCRLDNKVATGLTNNHAFKLEQIITLSSVQRKAAAKISLRQASVKISFLSLLPYGFRAPPTWS